MIELIVIPRVEW